MRQTRRIDSTRWCRRSWCLRNSGATTRRVINQAWEPGSLMSENGCASATALGDAVKYTVMMNMAPIFLRNSLQLGTYPKSAALKAALLQWCCSFRNFGANPTVSAGNATSLDDDQMQVDSLKKGKGKGTGKHQKQKGNRTTSTTNTSSTDIKSCKNWTLGEGLLVTSNLQKGKGHKQGIGNGKHVDVVETNQPSETASTAASTVWYPHKHRVQLEKSRALQRETVDDGCDINSVSTGRQAGAEYLLLDSGARLHACPITFQDKRYRCLILESTLQEEHDSNMTEDDWWHKNFQKDEQFECFSTRVQFRNHFSLLVVSLGSVLERSSCRHWYTVLSWQDPYETQPNTVAQRRELVLCQRNDGCALVDSWCKWRNRSRVTNAGRRRGADVCSFCNSQRSWHSRPNRDGTAQSETLSESALVQNVCRIPRTWFTTSRTVESDAVVP